MSQIEQAEKLLKKLNQDIAVAQERLVVAQNQADNLEKRNKAVIASIEQEGTLKKKLLAEQALSQKDTLNNEIAQADIVKRRLLDDISRLNRQKTNLDDTIDGLLEAKDNLDKQIVEDGIKRQELLDQILKTTAEIKSNEEKINSTRTTIRELETVKQQIEADIEILHNEADDVQSEIIELDNQFKNQKANIDNELYEARIELRRVTDRLLEAERKDKAFRANWAEEQLKLDKRTQAVRRMEARVSDAESRIEELKRYDIL